MDNVLSFPCDFEFKIFGLNDEMFEITALSIIKANFPDLKEDALKTRISKKGKYCSMSITVVAHSQEQLDNCYQDLASNEHILMTL